MTVNESLVEDAARKRFGELGRLVTLRCRAALFDRKPEPLQGPYLTRLVRGRQVCSTASAV
jgi:hypothetical protein